MKWERIAAEQAEPERVYNLFRRKTSPDLCCAVPEDRPVPAFLDGASWDYAGTLRQSDQPPAGFDQAAAEVGVQLNGFHLFQVARRLKIKAPARPGLSAVAAYPSLHLHPSKIDQNQGRPATNVVCYNFLRGGGH